MPPAWRRGRTCRRVSVSIRPTLRRRMVERLRRGGLRDELLCCARWRRCRAICSSTRRWLPQAYEDTSLPIGHGQTISKPSVVARMIELLLDGANARAQSAISAECSRSAPAAAIRRRCWPMLARQVISIERLQRAARARRATTSSRCSRGATAFAWSTATACSATRRMRLTTASSPPPAATRCRRPGSINWRSAAGWSRRCRMRGGRPVAGRRRPRSATAAAQQSTRRSISSL